jgi:hypothetical protein
METFIAVSSNKIQRSLLIAPAKENPGVNDGLAQQGFDAAQPSRDNTEGTLVTRHPSHTPPAPQCK